MQAAKTPVPAAQQAELMHAVAFNSLGGPDVLQPCLWSKPEPEKGRVLVRVVAVGVNPIDCKSRAGTAFPFSWLTHLPKVPGADVAGIVEHAGPKSKFKQGDRVFAVSSCFFPFVPDGCYAEFASVAEKEVAVMPEGLSFEEAAVMPLVTLTAWQGIEDLPLPPGSRILVHGGSGGVGGMGVQLAKHKGWHITATCSPKNEAYCKQLGADVTEDYHDPSFWERYSKGGQLFDVVLDAVGGSTMRNSLRVLKRGGYLVHVWTNADTWIKEAGSELRGKLGCITDLTLTKLRGMAGLAPRLRVVVLSPDGRQLAQVAALLEHRVLHPPRISRAFPLERASDAHAYFEGGHGAGKVLIKVARGPATHGSTHKTDEGA